MNYKNFKIQFSKKIINNILTRNEFYIYGKKCFIFFYFLYLFIRIYIKFLEAQL